MCICSQKVRGIREEKPMISECNTTFDTTSTGVLAGGTDSQSWLRTKRDEKRCEKGLPRILLLAYSTHGAWANDTRRATIAVYRVNFKAPVAPLLKLTPNTAHPVKGCLDFDEYKGTRKMAAMGWYGVRTQRITSGTSR